MRIVRDLVYTAFAYPYNAGTHMPLQACAAVKYVYSSPYLSVKRGGSMRRPGTS